MNDNQNGVDLSIIITAHNEGLLAHKTMLSVLEAVKPLEEKKITYEIIVSMDNPDEATGRYYERYENNNKFRIVKVSYGHVAESRNNAVKIAAGKYIALLDGDDLISPNFYVESYKMAQKQDGLFVLRPNIQLQFGMDEKHLGLWVMGQSFDKEKDALIAVQFNRWANVLVAPREIFNSVQYTPPTKGYGYEDYHFNAELLYMGVPQIIVPETTFFYRRKANGKQYEHINGNTLLRYTKLFDFDFIKSIDSEHTTPTTRRTLQLKPLAVHGIRRAVRLGKRTVPIGAKRLASPLVTKLMTRVYNTSLPGWLIEQWKGINHLENQLWPTASDLASLEYHMLSFNQDGYEATKVGLVYKKLVEQFTKKPDYIFFTYDELGAGGTEKVLFNYIRAIKKEHPDWHFAIFRKKPKTVPFDIPDGVDFIDFSGAVKGMHSWEEDILLDRLMVQSEAKRLHLFSNGWARQDFAYNWVRRHKKFLKDNKYVINVSWFMRELTERGTQDRIVTFADPYLVDVYDIVNKVFTDNQNVIDESLSINAFDKEKFTVHCMPIETEIKQPKAIDNKRPLRVLWAGRLSYQKRPDIVKEIGRRLDAREFSVDVYGRPQNYDGSKYFRGINSVNYKGEFNGFETLPIDNYDVFLYTSEVDGIPNVLLEATASGLPIIASNDGGVKEFVINKKTGLLVELEDIDGYVTALRYLKNNPSFAAEYVHAAQKLLKTQHTLKQFEESVSRDI